MSFDCKKGDGCGRDKIGQPMFTDTCGYLPDMERQQDGSPCVHGTGISGDFVGSLGTSTGPHSITDWLDLGWEGLTGHGGAGITVIVVVTTVIIALVLIEVIRRRRSRQISRESRNRRREQQRERAREALRRRQNKLPTYDELMVKEEEDLPTYEQAASAADGSKGSLADTEWDTVDTADSEELVENDMAIPHNATEITYTDEK